MRIDVESRKLIYVSQTHSISCFHCFSSFSRFFAILVLLFRSLFFVCLVTLLLLLRIFFFICVAWTTRIVTCILCAILQNLTMAIQNAFQPWTMPFETCWKYLNANTDTTYTRLKNTYFRASRCIQTSALVFTLFGFFYSSITSSFVRVLLFLYYTFPELIRFKVERAWSEFICAHRYPKQGQQQQHKINRIFCIQTFFVCISVCVCDNEITWLVFRLAKRWWRR